MQGLVANFPLPLIPFRRTPILILTLKLQQVSSDVGYYQLQNHDCLLPFFTGVTDFSIMPVQVTFASERSPETIEFEMNIADDTIHEADQIFALTLEVLHGVDPRRLVPERADGLTSLGRIIDDDS